MAFNVSYVYNLVDNFSAKASKIASKTKKMSVSFDKLKNRLKSTGATLDSIGNKLTTKLTLPITAAGIASAVSFGKFEAGLSDVINLLDSTAPEGFAARLDKVAKSGIKMGFTIEDTTSALFDSVSALGGGQEALDAFAIGQKLAIGGSASLSISVDGLTSIMNAYGKETTTATEVANAFFSAQKAGKTTVARLALNVGKVAPSAKAAGIGFKTLLATMSQLTLGGLSTAMASTGLRGAINSLVKPSLEAQKLLTKFGIASNATQLQSDGLVTTLSKLAKLAKKNPNLIARMIPEVEARTAIAALGEKEISNLREIIANINRDIANGTGLTEAFAKKQQTLNVATSKAFGNLKVLAITIGSIMAPAISKMARLIGMATTKFVQFAEANPKITKLMLVVAGLVAFLGPLAIAAGVVATAIGLVSVPILITTAVIGGIVLAISALIVFWDDLKMAMQNILDFWSGGFMNGIKTVGSAISGMIGTIGNLFTGGELTVKGEAPKVNGGGVASQSLAQSVRLDGNIQVNGSPGTIKSVESKTSGSGIGSLGLNMAGGA